METESKTKLKFMPDYPKTFNIAITAIMTSLVFLATAIIQINIPATGGYFNIGEIIIYITAILFGPIIGGIAGGLGAALADMISYPIFAPGTLIIKFCEGFVIGLLSLNIDFKKYLKYWRYVGIGLAVLIGGALISIGMTYYSATWDITIFKLGTFHIEVIDLVWIIIGVITSILLIIASIKFSPESVYYSTIIIIGGSVIVIGYFLYEVFIVYALLGIELIAAAEIPLNIG
ncbi:MAG: ECF transporter S component, partial [Candidatus Helarchaeota archaeon]